MYGVPNFDGSFHCFNKVGNAVFDLTSEQFDHPIEYKLDFPQSSGITSKSSGTRMFPEKTSRASAA